MEMAIKRQDGYAIIEVTENGKTHFEVWKNGVKMVGCVSEKEADSEFDAMIEEDNGSTYDV